MAAREPLSTSPRRAAVLGKPVAHSLSPALHRAAYQALALDGWTYDAIEVGVDGLPALFAGLDHTWAGLSVTMPLKQAVMDLVDDVSPLACAVGAVNTVVVHGGGPLRLSGDNTDVYGMVTALREAGVAAVDRAVVLGGGATGVSALAALRDLGCRRPTVLLRSAARSGALRDAARRLGVVPATAEWSDPTPLLAADVVVSTVPAGAADGVADALVTGDRRPTGVLLDVVYDPWPTRLATAWSAAGGSVVDGLAMLMHQAAAQVELFTGQPAPLAALREVVALRRAGVMPTRRAEGIK